MQEPHATSREFASFRNARYIPEETGTIRSRVEAATKWGALGLHVDQVKASDEVLLRGCQG